MQRTTRSRFVVLACLQLLLLASSAFAQDAKRARIGLGISISDVGEVVLVGTGNTPASVITPTILVPINISSRFRVEPEMGFYWNTFTNEATSAVPARTRKSTSIHFGAGAFWLASTERFTMSYGARIAYLRYTQSDVGTSGTESFNFPTFPGFFVAPSVGGEYFLSDHLSLGGEVQVRYTSSKATSANRFVAPISATTTTTHGAFVLRFYFPGSRP
jgi:hypothetical protein